MSLALFEKYKNTRSKKNNKNKYKNTVYTTTKKGTKK